MNNNYICHFGVKGMKWGVRHDKQSQINEASKKADRLSRIANDEIMRLSKTKDTDWDGGKTSKQKAIESTMRERDAFSQLAKQYASSNVATLSRKDIKKAKKLVHESVWADYAYTDNPSNRYDGLMKDYSLKGKTN